MNSNLPLKVIKSFINRNRNRNKQEQRLHRIDSQLRDQYLLQHNNVLQDSKFAQLFLENKKPIIEIGFGNGESLLNLSQRYTQNIYIGIESYFDGIIKVLSGIHENKIENLYLMQGDAAEIFKTIVKDNSLAGVQIFFPDPWPKKKHHKRRLCSLEFLQLLSTKIVSNGFIYLATDWQDYAEYMCFNLNKLSNIGELQQPAFIRPKTKYERRGEKLNHIIYNFYWQKF